MSVYVIVGHDGRNLARVGTKTADGYTDCLFEAQRYGSRETASHNCRNDEGVEDVDSVPRPDITAHNAAVDREQRIARETLEEAHWDAREHEARWGAP